MRTFIAGLCLMASMSSFGQTIEGVLNAGNSFVMMRKENSDNYIIERIGVENKEPSYKRYPGISFGADVEVINLDYKNKTYKIKITPSHNITLGDSRMDYPTKVKPKYVNGKIYLNNEASIILEGKINKMPDEEIPEPNTTDTYATAFDAGNEMIAFFVSHNIKVNVVVDDLKQND